MKNVLKAAACVALLASVSAHAETFDFSYAFGDGSIVTGSLEGSLVGDSVQNISDIHAALNGTAFTGTLNAAGFDAGTGLAGLPAIGNAHVLENNSASDLDPQWQLEAGTRATARRLPALQLGTGPVRCPAPSLR
ncbi:MAG TPA: hypothetical protein VNO35_01260, partial [Steroidobacteraceae bacterium]|nr:hypothetical protein [Steroidobacteraceae bacterium]